MKSCPSHCETAATGQSLTHGSNCCEEGRKKIASPSNVLHPNHCDTEPLLKTMKSCPSHCETSATRQPKKAASGAHPKRQSPSRFCVQAIAGVQPQKSRNVAFGTPKNNEIAPHKNNENVPQPLRNVRHQAKPKKAASGAHPKGRAPAGFASKPLRNCNLKNLETLLLEPLKTMKSCPSHCETSATRQSLRKLRRERIRKGRAPAGFASKPLRNCNLKNLETLLLEPLKTMKSCPSHCETSATRQSLRKLRRERIRKGRAPAGFASKPLRNCNLKNLETLLLEPLKTMNNEIVPQPLRNCSHQAKPKKAASGAHPKNVAFGTPKNNEIVPQPLRNFSHQAKPKKAASGAHPKRQSPSRFCVQAIAELQPQKSRNVAFGTPKNNEIVPQPLRNCSHQAKPKKAASGAHPKRQSPSRFCVQAIAGVQPQKSRNVVFGTPKNNEIEPHKNNENVPQPLRCFWIP